MTEALELEFNERNKRIGDSEKLSITLQGWRAFVTEDASEALWPVARRVRIVDPEWLKLDREMVIEEVRYSLSESEGTRTQLSLVPTEAYDLRVGSDAKAGGSGDGVVGKPQSVWDSNAWSREGARS